MVRELFRTGLAEVRLSARERNSVIIGLVLLLALVGAGLFGVVSIADQGLQRDLATWRLRLGLVAESRADAVEKWLDRQNKAVAAIADNTSVRLYVTQLSLTGGNISAPAQRQYLENLLNVTAERYGFASASTAGSVPANLDRPRDAGIAIYAPDGSVIATTRSMPDIRDRIIGRDGGAPSAAFDDGKQHPEPLLLFFAPLYGVQAEPGADQPMAWIAAARPLAADLYDTLRQPGDLAKSGESYLAIVIDDKVRHLTPLNGLDAKELPSDFLEKDEAARYAASSRGGMARVADYAGRPVLVVGRSVSGPLNWVLVRTVSADEALAEIENRRDNMLMALGLSVLLAAALILLVWRHGASVRAATAVRQIAQAAAEYERLSGFLEVVTNSQPTSILVLDDSGNIIFANRTAAIEAGVAAGDMVGKGLAAVFGAEIARPILGKGAKGGSSSEVINLDDGDGGVRILKADRVALDLGADEPSATLIVIEDMSELMAARARREGSLKGLVHMLVALIDARDPYSAQHSTNVAEIAGIIADEMGLDSTTIETVETAGALINLGKLTVPKDILTRPDNLSDDEMEIVRASLAKSADIIAGIDFDGPVAETLRQYRANWGGGGGGGDAGASEISGEDLLPSARVLSVANAFIAMLSPRAHRPGLDAAAVTRALMDETDRQFDRKVVVALIHYLDNEDGWAQWQNLGEGPEGGSASSLTPVD